MWIRLVLVQHDHVAMVMQFRLREFARCLQHDPAIGALRRRQHDVEGLASPPRQRQSLHLIQDDDGRPLTALALRSRFDKARKAAGVSFQFRVIRAKTASDTGDLGHSQQLLGHKNRDMTEHYVRERIGQRVKPLR